MILSRFWRRRNSGSRKLAKPGAESWRMSKSINLRRPTPRCTPSQKTLKLAGSHCHAGESGSPAETALKSRGLQAFGFSNTWFRRFGHFGYLLLKSTLETRPPLAMNCNLKSNLAETGSARIYQRRTLPLQPQQGVLQQVTAGDAHVTCAERRSTN